MKGSPSPTVAHIGGQLRLTRRAWLGAAAACLLAGCGHGQRFAPKRVEAEDDVVSLQIADHPALISPGGMLAITVRGHRHPILVQRLGPEDFAVTSLRCPVRGCTVRWDEKEQRLRCPCDDSRFDDRGRVLSGPAKEGLTHYPHVFSPINLLLRIDLAHPRKG